MMGNGYFIAGEHLDPGNMVEQRDDGMVYRVRKQEARGKAVLVLLSGVDKGETIKHAFWEPIGVTP